MGALHPEMPEGGWGDAAAGAGSGAQAVSTSGYRQEARQSWALAAQRRQGVGQVLQRLGGVTKDLGPGGTCPEPPRWSHSLSLGS